MKNLSALACVVGATLSLAGASKASEAVRDCEACPSMVAIPGGSFSMGSSDEEVEWAVRLGAPSEHLKSEQPRRVVVIKGFWLSVTEVTRDQFAAFVSATGYDAGSTCVVGGARGEATSPANDWRNPGFQQEGNHPVVCVSWNDAEAYVRWLSERSGRPYRLPTEAEWEYAARGGNVAGRHWGWENSEACRFANVADSAAAQGVGQDSEFDCTDGFVYTAPVGHFEPNQFGLYDMMGNVMEWTLDCYTRNYVDALVDGSARSSSGCSQHALRSSSWAAAAWAVRSAHRGRGDATGRFYPVGFRVARSE